MTLKRIFIGTDKKHYISSVIEETIYPTEIFPKSDVSFVPSADKSIINSNLSLASLTQISH